MRIVKIILPLRSCSLEYLCKLGQPGDEKIPMLHPDQPSNKILHGFMAFVCSFTTHITSFPKYAKTMMLYYPLAPGNTWAYKQKDGSTYTNAVTQIEGPVVTMQNSAVPDPTRVKIENGIMYNELMAPGNFQVWLKDEARAGDIWEASFIANGLNSIMEFTVKETGIQKEVDGRNYADVLMLEAESKIEMNGNRISTNFLTQYYYAKGIGLILTTSSLGDVHALQAYTIH